MSARLPTPSRAREFEERALEDLGVYQSCRVAMREAEASALPRLAVQAQQCIDRAMRLLRECCPPPSRPSPLLEPAPT